MLKNVNYRLGAEAPILDSIEILYAKKNKKNKRTLNIRIHQPILITEQSEGCCFWIGRWLCVTSFDALCEDFGMYGTTPKEARGGCDDFIFSLSSLREDYDFWLPGEDGRLGDFIELYADYLLDN